MPIAARQVNITPRSLGMLSRREANRAYDVVMLPSPIDSLDGRLIRALAESPRIGMLELARRLRIARGTAQARLDKLLGRGVITGFGPDLDVRALGYDVLAFTTLEIAQGRLSDVVEHLRQIPEVLEAHATSGPGDLHCRLAARTNEHLQDVINRVLHVQGITRTSTVIVLSHQIPYRVLPLVDVAGHGG
jgi:DNA-binding Lrp family transcriptional regulator